MNKTFKVYLGILVAAILLLAVLELNKKPVINWSLNYDTEEKSPFGLFAFDQEADALFGDSLNKTTQTPYELLSKDSLREPQNYLLIQKTVTMEGYKKLLKEVEKGSNLLIFSSDVDYPLEQEIHISSLYDYNDSIALFFTDKQLAKDSLIAKKGTSSRALSYFDPHDFSILGYSEGRGDYSDDRYPKFVKTQVGKGSVYLCLEPVVLTNYYLLNPKNKKFIENLFSFFPHKKTLWFQDSTTFVSYSPLRFILENDGLRYAWYILLFGIVTFMFFNAKRRQRIIPIIEPPANKSVEFVKSVGNLYLQEGNNKDMARKKTKFFLNKVREELYIDTQKIDESFAQKLHIKTGKPLDLIEETLPLIRKAIHPKAPVQQEELVKLNQLLDKIYK